MRSPFERKFRAAVLLLAAVSSCSPESLLGGGSGALAVTVNVTTASRSTCVQVTVTPTTGTPQSTGRMEFKGTPLKVAVYRGAELTDEVQITAAGFASCTGTEPTLERSEPQSVRFPWGGTTEVEIPLGPTPAPGDADGDGYVSTSSGGDDCNDRDRTVYPGAPEDCQGTVDTNCDQKTGCEGSTACVLGQCMARDCARLACALWQYCKGGVACEDVACAGIDCGGGKVCLRGECADTGCDGGTCSGGRVCDRGACVSPECYLSACAAGERCVRGTCTSCPQGTFPGGDGGTCVADLFAGASCTSPLQCATGTCSDGVCCDQACTGTCEACNLDGGTGSCDPVPARRDPLEQCGAYQCSGNTPACLTACVRDVDCKPTSYCDGALCQPRLPAGAGCTEPNRCLSNACASGVCCNTACDGGCEACNLDGGVGTCTPVPAGVDDEGDCPGLLTCNGSGGCYRPVSAPCEVAADCQSNFCVDGYCCDGRCEGTCEACNLAGREGACTPVAPREDPSDECAGPLTCNGVGACYRGNGVDCIGGNECESGACVDGVCCDRACAGTCEACDVAGNEGACSFVPVNTDPKGECPGVLTCTGNGACYKGVGTSCINGTECQSGQCVDGVCCTAECSGTCEACNVAGSGGTCTAIPARADPAAECGAYHCAGARGACAQACSEEADCKGGNACAGGACIPKLPAGTACVANDRCLSGFCVDGYCCTSACGGTCQACNVPNALGTCTLSPAGTDYGDDCGGYYCNGTGACHATCPTGIGCKPTSYCTGGSPSSRTCQPRSPLGGACTTGTTCLSGNCVDGVCCDAGCSGTCRACNLAGKEGTCSPHPLITDPESECGNTWCNGSNACLAACAVDGDCKADSYCNGGACLPRKPNGQACSAANQCTSGSCTDGVCCNSACGGTCQACNVTGAVGSCTPIPANTDPGSECGQLLCSGSPACHATCGSDSHCKAGLYCLTGTCISKKSAAATCTAGNQCASGFCADGVCCDSTCTGTCRACNVAGTLGTCVNVPAFADPASECAGDTTCSGSASCFKDRGVSCTVNGECQANACADGVCCDSDCAGTCRSCKLSGSTGTCTAVPVRTDPDDECVRTFCNGASACLGNCANDQDCETGSYCDGSKCLTAGVPGAPTNVATANGTSGSLVVTWTAPVNTGGGTTPLTGFVASTTAGGFSCTATPNATTCTLTGLTNGSSYQVQVFAQNGLGNGAASAATAALVVGTVPGAPGKPTLAKGTAGTLGVSWAQEAAAQGVATTLYTATVVGTASTCTATPPARTCTVTGLADGTSRQVEVTARNAVGTGPASTPSDPSPVGTAPDAPTSVVAVNGTSGTLSVSWTAPVNQGGGTNAVTSYTATASPGGATCTANTGSPVTTQCALTGLTNGTAYTVSVAATNAIGTSVNASPSPSRTVGTVPDAPTSVLTTGGTAGTLGVTWTAPANKGGGTNAITSYTATASPGGEKCTSNTGSPVTAACSISSLTDGVSYTVTVTATNAVGTGPASSASTAKLSGSAPGVPGAPLVVNGNGNALDVSWTASTAGTGGPTSYTATATAVAPATGSGTCTTSGTSCAISGLNNGTAYTVTVVASNAAGSSAASGPSSSKTVGTVPGTPGTPTVTNGTAGQLGVTWGASSSGSGGATSYVATASAVSPGTGSATCSGSGTSCTLTGLSDGTAYTVTVVASNATGSSAASSPSSAVTVGTAPGAPTGVTAANGTSAQLSVAWTAPFNKGGGTNAITSYTATTTPAGGTCSTSATNCTLTGLSDGTSYTVSVTATNAIGTSSASAASAAKTVGTVPSAPGTPNVTNGTAGTLGVSWSASTSNAGNAPLTYVATATAVAPATGSASCPSTPTPSCNITGLTDGAQYTVTVVASNTAGSGSASPASAARVVGTAPDAPTGVTLTGGTTGQLAASWVAPANKGGGTNAITSYTATASPGGATCTSSSGTPVVAGCTLTGLSDATAYTVAVTAANALGTSGPSTASAPKVVGTVPGAPTGITVTNGTAGTLGVSWTGGSAGTGGGTVQYTATATAVAPGTGGGSCGPSSSTSCNITGLTDGTSYTVTVVASNGAGTSPAAGPSSAKAVGTSPDAPTNVSAANGTSGQLAVTWTAPANKGGGTNAITSYTATATAVAPATGTASCTSSTGTPVTPSCTVTGLANGTDYTVTVTATNGIGTSSASSASAARTVGTAPATPTALNVTNGTASTLAVSWSAGSAGLGGGTVTYTATATAVAPGTGSGTCSSTSTSCSIGSLADGTAYTVTVVATSAIGSSAATAASPGKTVGTAPDAPTSVLTTNGTSTQLAVSWAAPANLGGGTNAVTSYTATATAVAPATGSGSCTSSSGSPVTPGCTVTGLSNGTAYTVTVTAANAVGTSSVSSASAAKVVGTVPTVPALTGVTNGTAGTLAPAWNASTNGTGGGTVQYVATAVAVPPAVGSGTCSTTSTTCNITSLTDGIAYTVTVVASNNAGGSAASTASAAKTVGTVPGAPTSVTTTNGTSGTLNVYWTPPANQGGGVNTVTLYTATANPGGATCSGASAACNITGLSNGTAYTVTVTATNAVGTSGTSSPSASKTVGVLPGAPTAVTATRFNANSTDLSWTAPAAGFTGSITGYQIEASENGGAYTVRTANTGSNATTARVSGLNSGPAYLFKVSAITAVGTGSTSAASTCAPSGSNGCAADGSVTN